VASGFGGIKGGGFGNNPSICWIAEALYGDDDVRTHILRAWLNGPFAQTWLGFNVMKMYEKWGRNIAAALRAVPPLKLFVRPLFDFALSCAIAERGVAEFFFIFS
jgi:hypothetical protein